MELVLLQGIARRGVGVGGCVHFVQAAGRVVHGMFPQGALGDTSSTSMSKKNGLGPGSRVAHRVAVTEHLSEPLTDVYQRHCSIILICSVVHGECMRHSSHSKVCAQDLD